MIFTITLVPFKMPEGVSIVSTDWEFSDDKNMNNILRYSYNDTENTHAIIFDYPLEAGRTYYARSKCLLTTGPLDYGPVSEIVIDEDSELNITTPSPINTPKLETPFWKEEHPHTCFTITSSPYEVIGNSRHVETIWTITELLTGKVVMTKRSEFELYALFANIKLDFNKQYVISAIYIGDNGDSSPRGSLIISTTDNLIIRGGEEFVSTDKNIELTKYDVTSPNVQHEWYLYDSYTNLVGNTMTRYGELIDSVITNPVDDGIQKVRFEIPYDSFDASRSDFVLNVLPDNIVNNDGTDIFEVLYQDGNAYNLEIDNDVVFPEITEDTYIIITHSNGKHDVALHANDGLTNITNIGTYTIKKEWLKKGRTYLLQGRTIDPKRPENKSNYFAFTTMKELNYGLPGAFPYKLGQGGDSSYVSTVENDKE